MIEQSSAQLFWVTVTEVLRERIPSADFFSWFAMAEPMSYTDDVLTLSFANDFAVKWVNGKFHDVLAATARDVAGRPLQVRLVSRETATTRELGTTSAATPGEIVEIPDAVVQTAADTITEAQLRSELGTPAVPLAVDGGTPAAASSGPEASGVNALNDRYRFDTFVIGEGNQLAHAAALSVAEAPGQSYNPLFIYGGTGLGKTHLLHAIGHYAIETQPGTTVAYVTTEVFVNRFIQAIQRRDQSKDRFKEYFRGIDILLMDDVQFLSGKSASMQEELFHTFNSLHESGRQVVLTSDCEPGSIPQLEDRLRSRFAWGLITDIATPDHATRVAILRKRSHFDRLQVPLDVLEAIAERITTNVRELEGALTRVVGYASLTGRPIGLELASQVLDNYTSSSTAPITIDRIKDVVCQHFALSHDDLVGPRRHAEVTRPRQIAMYLARVLLGAPSTHVGKRFGGRDHSTVLHAEKRIDDLIKLDREVYDLVEHLTQTIRTGVGSVQRSR